MYNAGIVGLGRIASTLDDDPLRKEIWTHAGAYKAVARTNLIAVCDINAGKLASFGRKWKVKRCYTDYKEMLNKEKLDILSVCTPTGSHYEIVCLAAKSGVKALFCEKPMAKTVKQAAEMVKSCKSNKVVLAVNHTRRWDESYLHAKKLIGSGSIGEIQKINAFYTAGIFNMGTHLFDILRFLCGEVSYAQCCGVNNARGKDPTLDGYLWFKKGFGCSISGLDAKNYTIFEINIFGTQGRIRINDNEKIIQLYKSKKSKFMSGYEELSLSRIYPYIKKQRMEQAVRDILKCIKTGSSPKCYGEDGKAALAIAAALFKSAGQHNRIIKISAE